MDQRAPWEIGKLRIDINAPYFYHADAPFFWLGDTAWLMFHSLTKEEITLYLENRAEKGFNVIQVVAAHKMPAKNVYGKDAFVDGNMTKPITDGENNYWEVLDFAVKKAEELGMYMGILPHWGGVVKGNLITIDQVEEYTEFLAKRYKDSPNVIWITGGDVKGDRHYDYWCLMAKTLKRVTPDKLVTFHPFGRTTSIDYFPEEDWMDFHMYQSGHRRYDQHQLNQWDDTSKSKYYYGEDSFRYVDHVHESKPHMPVVDGEPSYEHIPQGLHDPKEPFWQDYDVRRYAYWAVFAGAAGFTFGHSSIMQFFNGEGTGAYGATIPWKEAIHSPGSDNMCQLAKLMNTIAFDKGQKAQHLLACEEGEKYERIAAFAGEDFALFYTYTGRAIEIKSEVFNEKTVKAWWFDPVSGIFSYAGMKATNQLQFTVPQGTYTHTDWVLVLKPVQE